MPKDIYELKPDDLRAVIGGAIYYTSVNKLPGNLSPVIHDKAPALRRGFDPSPAR